MNPGDKGDRRSISDEVYERFRDEIVEGKLAAGDLLPPERDLAQQLGVNRQAVREGLQRLRQMNLVKIVHGGGSRVNNWWTSADIALLPELVTSADGLLRPRPAKALARLRVGLGTDIARLAARNVTTENTMALRNALAVLRTHYGVGRVESAAIVQATEDIWLVLAEMSGNVAHRLTNNAIRHAVLHYLQLVPARYTPVPMERQVYERMIDAVLSGDDAAAAVAARAVLETTEALLVSLIDRLPADTRDVALPPGV